MAGHKPVSWEQREAWDRQERARRAIFTPLVYVASRLENVVTVRRAHDLVRANAAAVNYDWTTHGSVADKPEVWEKCSTAEVEAASGCDFLVAFLPGGRGTHCEIGLAIGSPRVKRVLLVGSEVVDFCLFYVHPKVERCVNAEWEHTVVQILAELKAGR